MTLPRLNSTPARWPSVERNSDMLLTGGTRVITSLPDLEQALLDGLQDQWTALTQADPLASLFQAPGWCVTWYRCYEDQYMPFVIIVPNGQELVGIVPLAVSRTTRRLVFASDAMADYRDIVAKPGFRRTVVAELIRCYVEGQFPNALEVGWIDPSSDTPSLIDEVCRERGLQTMRRFQPCWRWFPPAPEKPSAHKFLNWYKRNGEVTFDVVETEAEWANFRDEYYRQHSLRQLQSGRSRAFHDPRRRAMYDLLFRSPDIQTHVTAFRFGGRMLAGHFGHVWRGVLLLGPPSIHLEHEQRSPAVILFSWIIQNAADLGLSGFDLTIGESDFKKRLGNQCVQLTVVEVYGNNLTYRIKAARSGVVRATKAIVARIAGDNAWKTRIKPAGDWFDYKSRRLEEMGTKGALHVAAQHFTRTIYDKRTGLVYSLTPEQIRPVQPRLLPGETVDAHDNCVEDMLLWEGPSVDTASKITEAVRGYARLRNSGRSLHTIVISGRLAGWGYSYFPKEHAQLTETPGALLEFDPDSVSLYDFFTIPEFRGRKLYPTLLAHIVRQRFDEGAKKAYIAVLEKNQASKRAIELVGFRLQTKNHYKRVFRKTRLTSDNLA